MKTEEKPFKQCPCCFQTWLTRDAFLSDKSLSLNGYKADLEKLEYGLFFFTHLDPSCNSTMAIEVSDFIDLYRGARYTERRTGEQDCPGYCLDKNQLERCNVFCECAFVREIIQIIKKRPLR
jgi:hypothetical protein